MRTVDITPPDHGRTPLGQAKNAAETYRTARIRWVSTLAYLPDADRPARMTEAYEDLIGAADALAAAVLRVP